MINYLYWTAHLNVCTRTLVLCEKLLCHYMTYKACYCLLVIENITLESTNVDITLNVHDLDLKRI